MVSLDTFLKKTHYPFLLLIGLYGLTLGLLPLEWVQREILFLHHVKVPLFADLSKPESFGLAPGKTRNFYLTTPDGETLGAWHILPGSVYRSLSPFPPTSTPDQSVFEESLGKRPTVVYFHGNAGTRGAYHRVRGYSALSNVLDCNVIVVDYRGFSDSTGTPSQDGLFIDARTSYDYVSSTIQSLKPEMSKEDIGREVILVGQSLGTGLVARLAEELALEGVAPRALVSVAGYTSITDVLLQHWLFHLVPIMAPLKLIPGAQEWYASLLKYPFNSIASLSTTSSPTLLLHAINDRTIPYSHSAKLFHSLHKNHSANSSVIQEILYPNWGKVRSFDRKDAGEVVWWEGFAGGHNNLGWAEGTLDLIARVANL